MGATIDIHQYRQDIQIDDGVLAGLPCGESRHPVTLTRWHRENSEGEVKKYIVEMYTATHLVTALSEARTNTQRSVSFLQPYVSNARL